MESHSNDFGRVWRFLGEFSLLHWFCSAVAGLATTFVAIPLMPAEWIDPQRYAAIGLVFLVPVVVLLLAIQIGQWSVRRMNRPIVDIRGYASHTEATVRVTLHGASARVWLECQIVDNSGPYRWSRTPFTPTWFYEGDAVIVRDQREGTDARLENGKAASVMLSKRDKGGSPWVRQPTVPGEDGGKPHAYVPLQIVAPDTEAWVTYRIRAVSS